MLGECYCNGHGVIRNCNEAAKCYINAIELGYNKAQRKLEMCLEHGAYKKEVKQDYKETGKGPIEALGKKIANQAVKQIVKLTKERFIY